MTHSYQTQAMINKVKQQILNNYTDFGCFRLLTSLKTFKVILFYVFIE